MITPSSILQAFVPVPKRCMEFMALHSGVLRNPEALQHDKHKSSKVAVSPTSGNSNPVWRQERKKHILEAASISSEETKTERNNILKISNQIFSLSVSLLTAVYLLHDSFPLAKL